MSSCGWSENGILYVFDFGSTEVKARPDVHSLVNQLADLDETDVDATCGIKVDALHPGYRHGSMFTRVLHEVNLISYLYILRAVICWNVTCTCGEWASAG